MPLIWFGIYVLVVYVIFSSFTALGWLMKVLADKDDAYEITAVPTMQCHWCSEYEYTEPCGTRMRPLCWDCANRLEVSTWEPVSIWHM